MTKAQDNDDAEWLDALSGKSDATSDSLVKIQTDSLRRALQSQSNRMNIGIPVADDVEYQKLLFRLRREGLTGSIGNWTQVVQWGRIKGQMAARVMAAHNTLSWGIAATAVLVVAFFLQSNLSHQGPSSDQKRDILRGAQGTVLIVPNPTLRAAELASGLKAAGTESMVIQGADGKVQLRFKSSTASLDYLSTQRIEPLVVDGDVILTLILQARNP